jgi:predicted NAD/FAD-binding protein
MIKDILRFNRVAKSKLEGLVESMTIKEFLKQNKFSKHFVENYIIPMGAAIWSTAAEKTIEMPAVFYIRFFKNHGLLQTKNRPQWRVIKGGSKSYIEKIKAGFEKQIKLSTPVKKIIRYKDEVEIFFGKSGEYSNKFDKVIIATHSDQALQMLEKPSAKEKEILGSLPYQENEALLHTDESILPRNKQTWSSWNYLLNEDKKAPVTLTYSMNILQSLTARTHFLVTLNSSENIDPNKILKKLIYQHPLFTVEGVRLQKEKHLINGKNNTFYCGAYWGNGFHEDGIVSALDVCKFFGKAL